MPFIDLEKLDTKLMLENLQDEQDVYYNLADCGFSVNIWQGSWSKVYIVFYGNDISSIDEVFENVNDVTEDLLKQTISSMYDQALEQVKERLQESINLYKDAVKGKDKIIV